MKEAVVTSQVFANILLHELDHFVAHTVHPVRYLRYGDDFLLMASSRAAAESLRKAVTDFLWEKLLLRVHPRNNVIVRAQQGLAFCGYDLFPSGRSLKRGTADRWRSRLRWGNIGSYSGLVRSEERTKPLREFHWRVLRCLADQAIRTDVGKLPREYG